METGYTVESVMRKGVLRIEPNTRIIDCAKIMSEKRIGSAVVCKDDKVVGIITEQDLSRKVLAKGINAGTSLVSDVMTRNVYTVAPQTDIYDAMVEMGKRKVKHLPVIHGGKLVGIISFKDVIRIQPDLIELVSFKSSLANRKPFP